MSRSWRFPRPSVSLRADLGLEGGEETVGRRCGADDRASLGTIPAGFCVLSFSGSTIASGWLPFAARGKPKSHRFYLLNLYLLITVVKQVCPLHFIIKEKIINHICRKKCGKPRQKEWCWDWRKINSFRILLIEMLVWSRAIDIKWRNFSILFSMGGLRFFESSWTGNNEGCILWVKNRTLFACWKSRAKKNKYIEMAFGHY